MLIPYPSDEIIVRCDVCMAEILVNGSTRSGWVCEGCQDQEADDGYAERVPIEVSPASDGVRNPTNRGLGDVVRPGPEEVRL